MSTQQPILANATLQFAGKQLADDLRLSFDERTGACPQVADQATSLDIELGDAAPRCNAGKKDALAERKSPCNMSQLQQFCLPHSSPDARETILSSQAAVLKVGPASVRNTPLLLQRLCIAKRVDFMDDATSVRHSTPDPEIFSAADGLRLQPSKSSGAHDVAAGMATVHATRLSARRIGDARDALATVIRALAQISAFRMEAYLRRALAGVSAYVGVHRMHQKLSVISKST